MYPRRYPAWDPPEIEDWRESYPMDYSRLCFPLAAIGTIGLVGAFAFCRPRRACSPRYGCYPYGCSPYLSCTPTYICYPRRCFPNAD